MEQPQEAAPGVQVEGDHWLFDTAREWAGKRKPKDMVIEVFVRMLQLGILVSAILEHVGLDQEGKPVHTDPPPADPGRDDFPDDAVMLPTSPISGQ